MAYIKLENLIQTMTPEQIILCSWFYEKFDCQAASALLHKKIINMIPLYYMGPIVGSEFETYDVNKMYLCLSAVYDSTEITSSAKSFVELHDEDDVIRFRILNVANAYDGSGLVSAGNTIHMWNKMFSRVTVSDPAYQNIKYIGYRATMV
jgi:hypothetical protein